MVSLKWVWDIPERIEAFENAGWTRTEIVDKYPSLEPGDWWLAKQLRLMVKHDYSRP